MTNFYFTLGIVFVILLIIRMILMFSGLTDDFDSDGDGEFDVDGDESGVLKFLSISSIINFGCGFCWGGYSAKEMGLNNPLSIIVAMIVGSFFIWIMIKQMKLLSKAKADYTVKNKDIIGTTGSVYLPIGKLNSSAGSIFIRMGGKKEKRAITNGENDLLRDELVKVIDIVNGTAIVEKL